MNFEEVSKDWKVYARTRHKKQGSQTIFKAFDNHVLPYFNDRDVKTLTKLDVLNWQNDILNKNYSNKYNAMLYYVFNSFMSYCVVCSYIPDNVVTFVGPFKKKIEYKEHRVYNIWQFRWFRFHLDNFVIKQYFNFMYFYGTRPSEAMALRFSDIDGLKVHIRHSLQRKGKRELDTPKNQSSIRTIRISLLMKFRIWLLKKTYINCSYDYFVFGGSKPLAPTTIDRYKKNACDKAHMQVITQHEFRHSYATRMVKKKPINYVSKTMGHSRVSTTLDVYLH